MEAALQKINAADKTLAYSISYGYANSTETSSGGVDDTYRLADQRMYTMKQIMHERAAKHADA